MSLFRFEEPTTARGTTIQVCGLWPFAGGSGAPRYGVPAGKHQRTGAAVTLDPVPVLVGELGARYHRQTLGAAWPTCGVTIGWGQAPQVERDGRDPSARGTGLVDVPGVEGGVCRHIRRRLPQRGDGLPVQLSDPEWDPEDQEFKAKARAALATLK